MKCAFHIPELSIGYSIRNAHIRTLRFSLRTIINLHPEKYDNGLLCILNPSGVTQTLNMQLLNELFYKKSQKSKDSPCHKEKPYSTTYLNVKALLLTNLSAHHNNLSLHSIIKLNTHAFWIIIS